MTLLATSLDLGVGFAARWVWQDTASRTAGVPSGIILSHGSCNPLYVAWAGPGDLDGMWLLESLRPLSLRPGVACEQCGARGLVDGGRWRAL